MFIRQALAHHIVQLGKGRFAERGGAFDDSNVQNTITSRFKSQLRIALSN